MRVPLQFRLVNLCVAFASSSNFIAILTRAKRTHFGGDFVCSWQVGTDLHCSKFMSKHVVVTRIYYHIFTFKSAHPQSPIANSMLVTFTDFRLHHVFTNNYTMLNYIYITYIVHWFIILQSQTFRFKTLSNPQNLRPVAPPVVSGLLLMPDVVSFVHCAHGWVMGLWDSVFCKIYLATVLKARKNELFIKNHVPCAPPFFFSGL